jgi:hypothetical protein
MIERVRAVLVTPDSCLLAIRRDRPDRASYWVLPGGHVDTGDQSLEAAGLTAIDLKPGAVAELLRDAIGKGRDLFTLPDLRATSRSAGFRHGGPALEVPPLMRSDRKTARSLDDQEEPCHD